MDDIYYALTSLMESMKERDKARDAYEGYSWGYHGQRYEDAVNEAKERFDAALDERILAVVKKHKETAP